MRSFGLWRAVVNRSRADWPVVVAAWLLLVSATTLLSAGALYGEAVAVGGLHQAILAEPVADRSLVIRLAAAPGEISALDASVAGVADATLGATGGLVARIAGSDAFAAVGSDPSTVTDLDTVATYQGIERHATLTAGRWPEPGRSPLDAVLSQGAATSLDLGLGDRVDLVSRRAADRTVALQIVGIWQPTPGDPYWLGRALDLRGAAPGSRFTEHGPFVIADADLGRAIVGEADVEWRVVPDVAALALDDVGPLARRVDAVRTGLGAVLPPATAPQVVTGLPAILDRVGRSSLVGRTGVLLLTIQFAVLAGYAIVLVAAVIVDRRRLEIALLRARGASAGHVLGMALAEAIVLASTAAMLAPVLALGAVRAMGDVGPLAGTGILPDVGLGPSMLVVAGIGGAAALLALALPTLTAVASPGGARALQARQGSRTFAQRVGLDLALLVLAGVALWQLRLYGAALTSNALGVLGVDPLLVAAPAIGLFAGAVLAIRIVPRLGELAERLLARRPGAVAAIGGRQLGRRPLRYSRSALLLMIALAFGTFAFAQSATWSRSQLDQAAYQAVADVRVVTSAYRTLPDWAVGSAYQSIPGVEHGVPISRASLNTGRAVRDGELIGLDPQATISLEQGRGGASSVLASATADLTAARPGPALVDLDHGARALSVVLDTDLSSGEDLGPAGADPGDRLVGVSALIVDGHGELVRVPGGTAAAQGRQQRITLPLAIRLGSSDIAITPPAKLEAIELSITPVTYSQLLGSIDVRSVEWSASGSDGWRPVGVDATSSGWSWLVRQHVFGQFEDARRSQPYTPPGGDPGRLIFGGSSANSLPAIVDDGSGLSASALLWATYPRVDSLPALVSRRLLALTGTAVGDVLAVNASAQTLRLRIVGVVDALAPFDPERAFAVVDRSTLEFETLQAGLGLVPASEWWLATAPGTEANVVTTLTGGAYSTQQVIGREALARSLSTDPVGLGVIGALGFGALAALIFAAIGFVVSASASTTERLGEFALLRALGLSVPELSAWLSLENVFLLAVGVLAGSALGLALAWIVLPVSTLTASGATPVPAPIVVVPWLSFAPILAFACLLLVVTVTLVIRQLRRVQIAGVLRAVDE